MTGSNNIVNNTIKSIDINKSNAENGIYNCIPCPLPRLSTEFVGLEQKRIGIITGSDKSSKTQFTNYLGVFNTLEYIKRNNKIDAKILYFSLEEDETMLVSRYILYLLKTKHNIICNYRELMSINTTIRSNIHSIVHSPQMLSDLNFFKDHVAIHKCDTIPEILTKSKKFAEDNGSYDKTINKYVPDNPNLYKIVIIDHIGLIMPMSGKSSYETLQILFSKLIILRDDYGFTFLLVQQQSANAESLDSKKADDVMPTKANLSLYRNSSNDCDWMLGIFNPTKVSKDIFHGYVIKEGTQPILGDNARFLKIMVQRRGSAGGEIGLYTDGPNAYFEELPPLSDTTNLTNLYQKMRNEKQPKTRQQSHQITNTPNQQVKLSFMARILSRIKLTKNHKKYSIVWERDNLPDIIEVDGNFLVKRQSGTDNSCKFCWLIDKCSSFIPCTSTTFWDPANIQEIKQLYGDDIEIPGYIIEKGKIIAYADHQTNSNKGINTGSKSSKKKGSKNSESDDESARKTIGFKFGKEQEIAK